MSASLSKYLLMLCVCATLLLSGAGMVRAAIDVYDFPDQQTEDRFRTLTHELRCPKCQNQNINDSGAPLARDIKDRVHALLLQGKSNDEITDFMVSRYGEFVTYRPRLSPGTLMLWLVPALAAVLALALLVIRARRVVPAPSTPADTPADGRRKVDDLLNKYAGEKGAPKP